MSCQHEHFVANVDVNRLHHDPATEVHAYAADVRVRCADCGASFGWRVPRMGMAPDDAYTDATGLELRVYLLTPAEMALMDGPAGMQPLPPLGTPGYRWEVRG